MKRVFISSILLVGVFLLSGCGQKTDQSQQKTSDTVSVPESSNLPPQAEKPAQLAFPSEESKPVTESIVNADTLTGYKESLTLLGSADTNIKLKAIRQFGELDSPDRASIAIYYFEKNEKVSHVSYNFGNKKAEVTGKNLDYIDFSPINFGDDFSINTPIIPESMIELGVDGVFQFLISNADFKKYKQENPVAFTNYEADSYYSNEFGWEWHVKFVEDGKKSYEFAINPESGKVIVYSLTEF